MDGNMGVKLVKLDLPGKHRKVQFFKAIVAGFGGKVDGN